MVAACSRARAPAIIRCRRYVEHVMLSRPNPASGVPIYLQLMAQVKHAVETGALRAGARTRPCPSSFGRGRISSSARLWGGLHPSRQEFDARRHRESARSSSAARCIPLLRKTVASRRPPPYAMMTRSTDHAEKIRQQPRQASSLRPRPIGLDRAVLSRGRACRSYASACLGRGAD